MNMPAYKGRIAALIIAAAISTTHAAAVKYAIQISIDSLGGKYLQFYVTNAPAQFPNFYRLMTEGAFTFNARTDYNSTESVPNHCTILTARPVLQTPGLPNTAHHGYNNNFPAATDTIHSNGNPNVAYKASVFDVVHDNGFSTAFYSGKSRLAICARSYNATNGAPDVTGLDNGRNKIDFVMNSDSGGSIFVDALLTNLNTVPRKYSFLHLNDADSTGHASGWGTAAWSNTVRTVDLQLGRILSMVTTNPVLSNQTAILLAADHGGGGYTPKAHSEEAYLTNYTVPIFIWAPGIPGGTNAYHLFANRTDPGTNRLDGNVARQPLRHGDVANVALALLGLPSIPGSSMIPLFAASNSSMAVVRSGATLSVGWPVAATAYGLEAADTLNGGWNTITTGITTNGMDCVLTVTNSPGTPTRFYRLKRQ